MAVFGRREKVREKVGFSEVGLREKKNRKKRKLKGIHGIVSSR